MFFLYLKRLDTINYMNIIAIIVSAAVCFIIGFLMHGPLFGKTWMKLANITPTGNEKMSDMWKPMVLNFITNIVCAYVLSGLIWFSAQAFPAQHLSWYMGVLISLWMWIGFVVPWTAMEVIWMKKSFKLWLFDTVSFLLGIAAMGAILAVW